MRALTSMRAIAVGVVATVLLIACSSSTEVTLPSDSAVTEPLPSPGVDSSGVLVESSRFGQGRALSARYSASADRLVVLTTVGLAVSDGWSGASRFVERISREGGHSALSPDGRLFAVVDGAEPMLEVWNLDDGTRRFRSPVGGVPGVVHSVAFDDDGSRLTVSTSASVVRWSLDGEPSVLIGAPAAGELGAAAVTPDGGRVVAVVVGAPGPALVEWTASAGARSVEIGLGPGEQLGRTDLSSDGSLAVVEVVSAVDSTENSLAVVDLAKGEVRGKRIGMGSLAASVWTLGPGDRPIIVQPTVVTVFDIEGNEVGKGDVVNDSPPGSVTAPPDGETFVTAHEDGSLVVWSLAGERLKVLPPTVGVLREVVRPDGSHVVTVGYSGLVDGWVVPEGGSSGPIVDYSKGSVNGVAISSDGEAVAIAYSAGGVDLTDSLTNEIEANFDHSGRNVDAVAFSPDSSRLATGVGERLGPEAFDDTITLWNARTGSAERDTGGEGENVVGCSVFRNLVRYSPDGESIAASSHDFTVTVYAADDLTAVLTLPPHRSTVLDIAFSRDGSMLATSSEDLTVRLWDLASGDLVAEHEAPLGGYWGITFAPDGSTLATIGATGSVRLVRAADGEVVQEFGESADWGSNVVFSGDGTLLAAGAPSGDVLVWNTADGTVANRLVGHADRVNAVAIAADDSFLVSGSEDGTARRWSLEP